MDRIQSKSQLLGKDIQGSRESSYQMPPFTHPLDPTLKDDPRDIGFWQLHGLDQEYIQGTPTPRSICWTRRYVRSIEMVIVAVESVSARILSCKNPEEDRCRGRNDQEKRHSAELC